MDKKKDYDLEPLYPGSTLFQQYMLIFGTSADPVHMGHIELIIKGTKALLIQGLPVTQIMLLPTFRHNPVCAERKDSLPLTFDQRFAMCELAASEISQKLQLQIENVFVSRLEEQLARACEIPNYTADTLENLREMVNPKTGFVFLLGEDALSGKLPKFAKWERFETIAQLAILAISPRTGYTINETFKNTLLKKGAQIIYLESVHIKDISSSKIKMRLRQGEDPLQLVEEGLILKDIAVYIKEHDLANFWGE